MRANTFLKTAKYLESQNCFWCNQFLEKHRATIDHLVPKLFHGKDIQSNVCISCHSCNHDRGQVTEFVHRVLYILPYLIKDTPHKKEEYVHSVKLRYEELRLKLDRWLKRHRQHNIKCGCVDISRIIDRL